MSRKLLYETKNKNKNLVFFSPKRYNLGGYIYIYIFIFLSDKDKFVFSGQNLVTKLVVA